MLNACFSFLVYLATLQSVSQMLQRPKAERLLNTEWAGDEMEGSGSGSICSSV